MPTAASADGLRRRGTTLGLHPSSDPARPNRTRARTAGDVDALHEEVVAQRALAVQLTAHSNAYAESLFRTAKYRPEFPAKGFADLDAARTWAAEFVRWYNDNDGTVTAASATSPLGSDMTATIRPSWQLATRCTSRPASATQRAGPARHATGHRPAQSPSIPNATRSSRCTRQQPIGSSWLHE